MIQLQAMPVADAMSQPGRQVWLSDDNMQWSQDLDIIQRCKRINYGHAPEPVEILKAPVSTNDELVAAIANHVGPQRLPFDHMWLEGESPWAEKYLSAATGERVKHIAVRAASNALREQSTMKKLDNPTTSMTIFGLLGDGSIVRFPVATMLSMDDSGTTNNLYAAVYDPEKGLYTSQFEDSDKIKAAILSSVTMAIPAMWAIGMMNCRNITTKKVNRTPTRTKKQRRFRTPGLSYHTIVLPDGSAPGESRGGHRDTAIHQVRGHFKTFTEDRPLMGQHVGTYWWGWQIRGNPAHGEVQSDYKIAR